MLEIQLLAAQLPVFRENQQDGALNAGSGTGPAFKVMVWFPLAAPASPVLAHCPR